MSTSTLDKIMVLRREVRDLEQKAELLDERAKHTLATKEASARFNQEAQQHRTAIAEKRSRITTLESSKQTTIF